MSRIHKIIADLPDEGIPFIRLADLGRRNPGTPITAARMKALHVDGGPVRVFAGGQTVADVREDCLPPGSIIRKASIIVKSRGNIGFSYYDRPFSHKSEIWSYTITSLVVLERFVYYYLLTRVQYLQDIARATSVKLPQLSVGDTDSLRIPVPPLEVQREIVAILDKFTMLEAELEAELEARARQHDFFRRQLLAFASESVPRVALSEAFETRNGYTPSKADEKNWTEGVVPWIRMDDIRELGRTLRNSIQKIPLSAVKGRKLFPAQSLIFATSATVGEHAIVEVPFLCNQRFTAIWPTETWRERFDPRFLFHYGFVIDEWCANNTTTSSFATVDMKGFRALTIPVPPLAEQRRIADILDRFDALVNDLSIGLPAELAARRRQYEHYRDRLLTFDEEPA